VQTSDPSFYREPRWLLEFFAWSNLAFLALDIYVAHSVNDFALWEEWIPFGLSITATLALFPGLLPGRLDRSSSRWIGGLVGGLSIAVGVLGLLFHLHDTFFVERTLKNLVYSAPFVAPLSYSGIGLLLILNRSRIKMEQEWAAWIVFLALGGFVGNFVLSLGDHAQNGFFVAAEWIPVIASAFAVSFLFTLLVGRRGPSYVKLCGGVMLVQILVGLLGAGMHLRADWHLPAEAVRDRFIHGAPIFAPLLFADLAILALLGLWCLNRGSAE
jgi:hypothetical protein